MNNIVKQMLTKNSSPAYLHAHRKCNIMTPRLSIPAVCGEGASNFASLQLSASAYAAAEKPAQSAHEMAGKPPPELVRGQAFDVGPRYTGLTYIGEGAYGMVW